jgi:CHAP domain-containing protein
MAIANEIVNIAIGYSNQNITEVQVNDGWTDASYQADMESIGWQRGDEWCAASVILDWKKGYAGKPDVWAKAARLVSLNSQQMARNFHADPVWPTSANVPKLGAIVVWQDGNSATSGHCGIVVAVNGNKFTSVEGNTTSTTRPNPVAGASEREGWTVAEHIHTIGLPHTTRGLNLDRFIYAIESYDPLVE